MRSLRVSKRCKMFSNNKGIGKKNKKKKKGGMGAGGPVVRQNI